MCNERTTSVRFQFAQTRLERHSTITFIMQFDRTNAPLLFLIVLLPTAATNSIGVGLIGGIARGIATWAVGWGALEHYSHASDHKNADSRHMKHHKDPKNPEIRDVDLVAMKDRVALYLIALFFAAGVACVMGNIVGLTLFYVNYESVHRLSHISEDERETMFARVPASRKKWLLSMVQWHGKHHDAWGTNYGVTTPFWDIVAGTASKKMAPRIAEMRGQDSTLLSFALPVSPIWSAHEWLTGDAKSIKSDIDEHTKGPDAEDGSIGNNKSA
jgi:hypothetical protein